MISAPRMPTRTVRRSDTVKQRMSTANWPFPNRVLLNITVYKPWFRSDPDKNDESVEYRQPQSGFCLFHWFCVSIIVYPMFMLYQIWYFLGEIFFGWGWGSELLLFYSLLLLTRCQFEVFARNIVCMSDRTFFSVYFEKYWNRYVFASWSSP